mgnify:CR=1 FL=1
MIEAADLVIPLRTWAEKDALWVNKQGRIQRGQRAVAAPGDSREDWRRSFGGADDDRAEGIDRTLDGGYVVAGTTRWAIMSDTVSAAD